MKFQKTDQRYLASRRALSERDGPRELWSTIDHWPLYCGVSNLARSLAVAELVRESLLVPGDIAEFGAWRGANTVFMAKLLRIYDPLGPKQVHCFDSFEGLGGFTPQDGVAAARPGAYKGSLDELREVVALYELEDDIVIRPGKIEEVLPRTLAESPALSFSLVYCDVDLYRPTAAILDLIHPRLVKGGAIVFDEWNYESFPGEGIAANEFLAKHGGAYEVRAVPRTRSPSLVARKLTAGP